MFGNGNCLGSLCIGAFYEKSEEDIPAEAFTGTSYKGILRVEEMRRKRLTSLIISGKGSKSNEGQSQLKRRQDTVFEDTQKKLPLLARILRAHERESVTDEQVQKILEPVIIMIDEGKFDRTAKKDYSVQ